MVISGPNTGGKTVALKTVGLAALSAQSGIPVAAERAELPIFDRVLADIGDEQSIAADLSTFSAHMLNLKSMLEVATERSLILVDEMGTGTAPEEGAALAVALLEEFRARRALTLATTHHDRLKAYASTTPGIVNAAMEFDEENLRPTYRLLVGVPGTSSGIEIARRLGLPERVVEHAQREPFARIARGARPDRLSASQPRRNGRDASARPAKNSRSSKPSGARCRPNGSSGRKSASPNWKRIFARRRSGWKAKSRAWRRTSKTARCARRSKSRPGAAWGRSPRKLARKPTPPWSKRSPHRSRIWASSPRRRRSRLRRSSLSRGQRVTRERIQAAGDFSPPRWPHGRSGSRAAAHEGAARGHRRHRRATRSRESQPRRRRRAPRGITVHAQPSDEPAAEEINVIGCTVEEATAPRGQIYR